MLATGKAYGLEVTSLTDDRRDPVKSSYAAARYLRDLYQIFGDWNLVIAAYNAGPESIKKAIARAGGERDYWKIYPYLPSETRGYVPAFIAATYMMTYYCEHNICPMITKLPERTDTIMLYKDVHLEQVAHVLNIDIEELRTLNPQYRRDIVTGYSEPTDLRLPVDYISKFIEKEDEIVAYNADLLMKRDYVYVNDTGTSYSKKYSRHSRHSSHKSYKSHRGSSSKKSHKRGKRRRR
jgi:membrane-bound lytic murein transglycosylase D